MLFEILTILGLVFLFILIIGVCGEIGRVSKKNEEKILDLERKVDFLRQILKKEE